MQTNLTQQAQPKGPRPLRRTLAACAAMAMAGTLLAGSARAAVTDVSSAGTLFWGFDASDVGTDANGVTSLNNQAGTSAGDAVLSGLGTDITSQAQVVSSNTGNGLHDVIDFDGGADTYLADFGTSITGVHNIFIVVRFDENSGESVNNYVIDGEDNNGRRATGIRGTTSSYFTSDGGDFITSVPISLGEWQVITLTLGGTFNQFRVTDGTPAGTYEENQSDSNVHPMTGITVGGRTVSPNAQTRLDGQVAEILVYETNLSTADRTAVTDHLLNKYINVIPEPASIGLLGLGALAMLMRRRA